MSKRPLKTAVYDDRCDIITVMKDEEKAKKFRNKMERRYNQWFGVGSSRKPFERTRSKQFYANGKRKK